MAGFWIECGASNFFFSIRWEMSIYYAKRNRQYRTQTADTKKYLERRLLHCGLFGHHKKVVTLQAKKKGRMKEWAGILVHCREYRNGIIVRNGHPMYPDRNSQECVQVGPWLCLKTPPEYPSGDINWPPLIFRRFFLVKISPLGFQY